MRGDFKKWPEKGLSQSSMINIVEQCLGKDKELIPNPCYCIALN